MSACDILVVGAGPAGLAAAATAAESGTSVCLVDDNPSPGGQIWRQSLAGKPVSPHASRWLTRMESAGVRVLSGCRVVDAPAAKTLRVEREGSIQDIQYSALILATGARERFLPFPGWTLPGVYGAGALQAFVKSGLDIHGKRVVVAGTGPLLPAVAANLRRQGADILAVAEQAPATRLATLALTLLPHPSKLQEAASLASHLLGVPYRTGSWVAEASGEDRLESVKITSPSGSSIDLNADFLAIGYHLIPNTELPQLLHCKLERGFISVDRMQRSSVAGVYCAGEVTGIGGAEKAQIEGQIAALAASGKTEAATRLANQRERHLRFVRSLDSAFALRDELRTLPTSETVVCRCEDITHGALAGCRSWREAKLHTRCGMGPCQGRICSPATQFLYGWEQPQPRPPLFPVEAGTLAGMQPELLSTE